MAYSQTQVPRDSWLTDGWIVVVVPSLYRLLLSSGSRRPSGHGHKCAAAARSLHLPAADFRQTSGRLLRRHANRSLHRQVKGVDAGKATNVPRAPAETGADDLASTSHGQLCFQRSLDSLAAGTSHLDFIPRVLVAQKLAGQAAKASMFQLVRCQP